MKRRQLIKMGATLVGSGLFLLNETTFPSRALARSGVYASQPPFDSTPIAMPSADGRLELFQIGSGGNLYHSWQVSPGRTKGWSAWYNHGNPPGLFVMQPRLWYNSATQRLRLYSMATPTSGLTPLSFYYLDQVIPSANWGGWQPVAPSYTTATHDPYYSTLTIGTTANNLASFFVGGSTNGTDALLDYLDGNSQNWLAFPIPANAGYGLGGASTASGADGRQEFFAVMNGQVYHRWQNGPNADWSDWYSHGIAPSGNGFHDTAVAANADGRLELFAQDGYGRIYHKWQSTPDGAFSSWASVSPPSTFTSSGSLVLHANEDGRLVLFSLRIDGAYHIEQITPNGGWSGWYSHGLPPGGNEQVSLSICSTNNTLVIFTIDSNTSNINYLWQTAPNSSDWGSWFSIAHP